MSDEKKKPTIIEVRTPPTAWMAVVRLTGWVLFVSSAVAIIGISALFFITLVLGWKMAHLGY